jgi:hypothetical protein
MTVPSLSDRAREVVASERDLIRERLSQLQAQSARLHALAADLDKDVEDTTRMLRTMDEMLGLAPQLSLESANRELRGQRLQDIAVEVLRAKRGDGSVVHYREWYGLVTDAGVRVAGKDPLATFLTQISRSPSVESVRPRSGLYRLLSA